MSDVVLAVPGVEREALVEGEVAALPRMVVSPRPLVRRDAFQQIDPPAVEGSQATAAIEQGAPPVQPPVTEQRETQPAERPDQQA